MKKTQAADYYLAAFISIATFIIYLSCLQNDFVAWDDDLYIFDNPYIRSFDPAFFKWAFSVFRVGNWHPLTWISHALDYAVWGLNPLGHHLTNTILHTLNTFVVVVLVVRLLEAGSHNPTSRGGFQTRPYNLIAAATTGLLFGLHPIHVESVAWVSERKDLLCALFFLLSIMAYLRYQTPSPQSPPVKGGEVIYPLPWRERVRVRRKWYLLSLGFFVLALLSKPMAVTLPVVLLILDWFPFERVPSFRAFRGAIAEKLPFIALSIVSSILAVLAQRAGGALVSMEFAPLETRVLAGVKSLIAYLWKMALPMNLTPFYPYARGASLLSLEYLSAIAVVSGITITCIVLAKKHKLWLSVWGYYVITLLPVLGIVQVGLQSMADRYAYLPSLAPFLVIGILAAWVWERMQRMGKQGSIARFLTVIVSLIVFISLSYLTFRQIGIWKNSIVLWSYVIEKEPEKIPVAYYNRGMVFEKAGLLDKAVTDYNKAVAIKPSYYEAFNNRGLIFQKMGLLDKAIADFDTAIALKPSYYEAFNNRGLIFQKMGLLDNAIKDLELAATLKQFSPEAYDNLGKIYSKAGRFDKAIENLNRAIEMNPLFHEAYYNRAIVFEKVGQPDAAIENYNKAIALNPSYYEAYNNLGVLYGNTGLFDRAIEHFTKAILLNQNLSGVYVNRGVLYARTGNKDLAVSDFQKACGLGNKAGCSAVDAF